MAAVNAHKDVFFKNLEEKKLQSKMAANVNLHLIDDYLSRVFFFPRININSALEVI